MPNFDTKTMKGCAVKKKQKNTVTGDESKTGEKQKRNAALLPVWEEQPSVFDIRGGEKVQHSFLLRERRRSKLKVSSAAAFLVLPEYFYCTKVEGFLFSNSAQSSY